MVCCTPLKVFDKINLIDKLTKGLEPLKNKIKKLESSVWL